MPFLVKKVQLNTFGGNAPIVSSLWHRFTGRGLVAFCLLVKIRHIQFNRILIPSTWSGHLGFGLKQMLCNDKVNKVLIQKKDTGQKYK